MIKGCRELDEQITLAVDGVFQRMGNGIGNVIGVEVKITREAELDFVGEQLAQLGETFANYIGLIGIPIAGMGCADDVSYALGGGFRAPLRARWQDRAARRRRRKSNGGGYQSFVFVPAERGQI